MLRGGEGTRRGPRIDRMGGLVLAMILGVLVPPLVVSVLASRQPLPRNCGTGQVSGTRLDGALLYTTTGGDVWYSEGHPGQPRKLLDIAPRPPRGAASPSPGASPAAASPNPAASASPGVPSRTPRVLAADISADRRLAAVLVYDAPDDRAGFLSLRLMSALDAPGKAPTEAWFAVPERGTLDLTSVRILDNGKVVIIVAVPRSTLPAPFPVVAVTPSPSPSAKASPQSSPSASASASPTSSPSPRATAGPSPSPSPSPPTGPNVVVVVDGTAGHVVDQAPLDYFLNVSHARWADTRPYRLRPGQPRLSSRVDGPLGQVAGVLTRQVTTPLAVRRLNQVMLGRAGEEATHAVCSAPAGTVPAAFSPDESGLALYDGQSTSFLDLSGTHAPSRLIDGRILAWRA